MSVGEEMQGSYDWHGPWAEQRHGYIVSFLLPLGYPEYEDTVTGKEQDIADELAELVGARSGYGQYVDPYVGASGWGIGLALEFLQVAAEVATLAVCRRESHGGKIPSFLNPFQLAGGAPDGSIIPPGNRSGKKIGCFRSLRQTARGIYGSTRSTYSPFNPVSSRAVCR